MQSSSWNLQLITSVIAIVDMGLSLFMVILLVVDASTTLTWVVRTGQSERYGKQASSIITSYLVFFLLLLGDFALGILLKTGSEQRNLRKCKIWFLLSASSMLLSSLLFMVLISSTSQLNDTMEIVLTAINFVYQVSALCIVYKFIQQLQREEDGGSDSTTNATTAAAGNNSSVTVYRMTV